MMDLRFDSYLAVLNNLEKLLWGLLAFMVAISAFAISLVGDIGTAPFQTTVGFFLAFAFYVSGARGMQVLKKYRNKPGEDLKLMEDAFLSQSDITYPSHSWYFTWRNEDDQSGWWEATNLFVAVFYALGCMALVTGVGLVVSFLCR